MALRSLQKAAEASASLNIEYERESKQVALAWYDKADDEVAVLRNCGLTIGSRHPSDFGQVLSKIEVELANQQVTRGSDATTSNLWKITASYGPWNPAERGDPAQAGNPLAIPPRFRLEWERHPEPVWQDIDGNAIQNTCGDCFDPPIEVDNLIGILTVERNEAASVDIATIMGLSGNVNEAQWNGFAAKTVRVAPIGLPALEYSQEANVYFFPFVYVFEINFKTWTRQPLNAGYRQQKSKVANISNIVTILDDAGQPLQVPGLLDQNGAYLRPPVAQNAIITGSFDVHQPTDFSAFNLDNLFTPPAVLS